MCVVCNDCGVVNLAKGVFGVYGIYWDTELGRSSMRWLVYRFRTPAGKRGDR